MSQVSISFGETEMSAPFTENIVGSWLFVRLNKPDFKKHQLCHFTPDGKLYWEINANGRRIMVPLRYRFSESILTVIYSSGAETRIELVQEEDGTVRVPSPDGIHIWWKKRLSKPESYSLAFIDNDGNLLKLKTPNKTQE